MSQPTQVSSRYRSLDVWRGVFCIVVVLEHAGVVLWTHTFGAADPFTFVKRSLIQPLMWNLGAPLFFVVSGFCVAASIESHRRKGMAPGLFLVRRFWRIFPPYWAALFLFVAMVVVLDTSGLKHWHHNGRSLEIASLEEIEPLQWLGNLTLSETWRPKLTGGSMLIVTRVAWSLCYQEQFYLICFLLLVLFPRHYGRSLAWATAVIVAFHAIRSDMGAGYRLEGLFPRLWHEFAVGLGVYWRINGALSNLQKRSIELAIAALFVAACHYEMTTSIAASAFGLTLIAFRPLDERIDKLRWLDPLRACGRRSYSVYLVHLPACILVCSVCLELGVDGFWMHMGLTVPLSAAVSLGAGWLFHRWVDIHFTKLPQLRNSWIGRSLSPPPSSLGEAAA